MTRKPLIPLPESERISKLRAMGLDGNMVPLNATDAEIKAAERPGLGMEETPVVKGKAVGILFAVGTLLGIGAGITSALGVPQWVPFALSAAGGLCLFLAGKPLPAFKVGGPLVPPALAGGFLAFGAALATFAGSLNSGLLQGGVLFAAALFAGLAGKAAPGKEPPVIGSEVK